ncbi:MAG: endonuclease/exonuclease/phosphatase family protein [Bacteroidales bacterium]|nr:endonuclease/exonuclease/phosphatase family protein [Bacteroidales bacterium]
MRRLAAYLLPCLLAWWAGASPDAEAGVRFKAGTYNLFTSDSRLKNVQGDGNVSPQRLWCHSYTAVGDMLVRLDCDIIGLQEICDSIWNGPGNIRDDVASKGLGYQWILYPNTRRGHISYDDAIGYKPEVFECIESGIFWMGGVFDKPEKAEDAPEGSARPTVWAHMRHRASGREFYFLSTHLHVSQKRPDGTWSHESNQYNARQLCKWVEQNLPYDMPGILVGDMNLDDKAKHWSILAQTPFMDAKLYFEHAGRLSADAKEWGTQNKKDESGFTRWYPDHIMVNGFRPLDYVIDRGKFPTTDGSLHFPSDHLPLTCTVEFLDYAPSGRPTAQKGKKAIRTMSFNVRYFNNNADYENGWDHRKRAIPAMLEDVKPDVVGTQEITDHQIAYLDDRCPAYRHVGIFREPDGKKECGSIYYNSETVELLDWGGFHLSETPQEPSLGWDAAIKRTAVWARLRMKGGHKEFIFVTTHLDHKGQEAREKGLDLILDTLGVINSGRLPVVIVGDFNMTAGNKGLARISREMKDARETAHSSDSKYAFNGFGKSWTGNIDYIWHKGFKRCTNFKVIHRKYLHINYISDHYPIIADVETF